MNGEILFVGIRRPDGTTRVYADLPTGQRRRLHHRVGVRSHSPTGFEWGYEGSGPAELAYALCQQVAGQPVSPRVYQRVKRLLVAPLGGDRWILTESQVAAAIGCALRESESA